MISILLAAALLLAVLSIVYRSIRNGITPMPASIWVRMAVAHELNRLPEHLRIVEAGSGWGTLAQHIAKYCPGRRIIGIENSSIPLGCSRLLAMLSPGRSSIAFKRGDLYVYPYEQTDLVVCYLYPGAMARLGRIWEAKLPPHGMIISVCFALPGWQADRIVTCRDHLRTRVYVYNRESAGIR